MHAVSSHKERNEEKIKRQEWKKRNVMELNEGIDFIDPFAHLSTLSMQVCVKNISEEEKKGG